MRSIIHFFRCSQFDKAFVEATRRYCNNEKHFFLIYGNNDFKNDNAYLYYNEIRFVYDLRIEVSKPCFKNYLSQFELIVYHGLFDEVFIDFLYHNEELLKNTVLYFWGGDIVPSSNLINEQKRKYVIENARAIANIVESDYVKLNNYYNLAQPNYVVMYQDDFLMNCIKKLPEEVNEKKRIIIQIGNSGAKTNRHIDMMEKLLPYRDQEFSLLLPLSYGDDKEYISEVERYAEEMFGENLIILKEKMNIEDYIKILAEVDIGIFAMRRQQALGNISILYGCGAKLYFDCDGQVYDYYLNEIGYKGYDIKNIGTVSYGELIDNDRLKNREERLPSILSGDKMMQKWSEMYGGLIDGKQ